MPKLAIGKLRNPFLPLNASLDNSLAFASFFSLISFISSFASVPFMNPLTFARRLLTSDSRFAPFRRRRRISCCCSNIGSRPAVSLLLLNHPAVTARGRRDDPRVVREGRSSAGRESAAWEESMAK